MGSIAEGGALLHSPAASSPDGSRLQVTTQLYTSFILSNSWQDCSICPSHELRERPIVYLVQKLPYEQDRRPGSVTSTFIELMLTD